MLPLEKFTLSLQENLKSPQMSQMRMGQIHFFTLEMLSQKLANEVRGTDADPFYKDKNIPNFLGFVYGKLSELESFDSL